MWDEEWARLDKEEAERTFSQLRVDVARSLGRRPVTQPLITQPI